MPEAKDKNVRQTLVDQQSKIKFDRSKLHEDIDYLLKDQLHQWTGSGAPFKLEKT